MARIVQTQTKVTYGARIINYLVTGGTESNTFFVDDKVDKLSYVKDGKTVTLSGRVANIDLLFKSTTNKSNVTHNSFLLNDAKVASITIDYSTKNNAAVDIIPGREILEYNASGEVKKVDVEPVVKVGITSILSDGSKSSMEINEGDTLFNVTFINGRYEITGDFKVGSFVYKYTQNMSVKFVGVVLYNDKMIVSVPFESIKSCGSKGTVIDKDADLNDAISKAISDPDVAGIVLPAATYTNNITLGTLKITGSKFDVVANSGARCTDTIAKDETVIAGTVTANENTDVEICGVTFTENANFVLDGATSIKFKNCKFTGLNPVNVKSNKKSYAILDNGTKITEAGIKIEIEGCYFGNNVKTDTGYTYNYFEINNKIADGSYIKNCYFAKEVGSNNTINIYDVVEGSEITIRDNFFEDSHNAIRVGIKGNATATLDISNNTYASSDTATEYQGLMLIQPYGKVTESMANINIYFDNNVCTGETSQDYYIYYGPNDTQLVKELQPKIYVNGTLQ